MSLSRNHSQKCVYSLGQHLFKMYFKTKLGLILGCRIFENTIQWKVSLKGLGLPLLLFRIHEFIKNSSFTFPQGFFNILKISKITRLWKTAEQMSVFSIFHTVLFHSVNTQYLMDIWRQCCPCRDSPVLLSLLTWSRLAGFFSLRNYSCLPIDRSRIRVQNGTLKRMIKTWCSEFLMLTTFLEKNT